MEKLNKIIDSSVRKYLNEDKNRNNKTKRIISEATFQGKTIINVDIQPEYEDGIGFDLNKWVKFINQSSKANKIIFLYNGAETLGMIDKNSYVSWLFELGVKESVLENATFYDKGYAFFRYCIDNSIDEENIADLVKYILKYNINDTRDFDEEMWDNYMAETNHDQQDIRDLLEYADDMINIPDLMGFLQNYSNIILLGGGIYECLKEVEIALLALDKQYNTLNEFTY